MDSSHSLQNASSSPAVAGVKRKALFSSLERAPKRAITESVLDTLPTADGPPIHLCSDCHRPCWYCEAASAEPPENPMMAPPPPSTSTRSEVSKGSSSKRKREDGLIFAAPKDPGFEEYILLPCKVEKIYPTWDEGFGPGDVFGEQSEIASSDAMLKLDQTKLTSIAQQFNTYKRRADNENALGVLFAQTLLINEILPQPDGPVQTVSFYRDRWRPHKPGPPIPSDTHIFDWDVEPDVTYMVSIHQFDIDLRKRLKVAPLNSWLAEMDGSCPYLTIEYKCGDKGGKMTDALNQNVCASIIWLYQRRGMREELAVRLQ